MSLNEILSFMTSQAAMNAVTLAEKEKAYKELDEDHKYIAEKLRQKEKRIDEMYDERASMQRELERLRILAARYETEAAELRNCVPRYASEGESLTKIGLSPKAIEDFKREKLISWIAQNGSGENSNYLPPGKTGKIACIRIARDVLGLGLKDAKEFVETLKPFGTPANASTNNNGCPSDCGCDGN